MADFSSPTIFVPKNSSFLICACHCIKFSQDTNLKLEFIQICNFMAKIFLWTTYFHLLFHMERIKMVGFLFSCCIYADGSNHNWNDEMLSFHPPEKPSTHSQPTHLSFKLNGVELTCFLGTEGKSREWPAKSYFSLCNFILSLAGRLTLLGELSSLEHRLTPRFLFIQIIFGCRINDLVLMLLQHRKAFFSLRTTSTSLPKKCFFC